MLSKYMAVLAYIFKWKPLECKGLKFGSKHRLNNMNRILTIYIRNIGELGSSYMYRDVLGGYFHTKDQRPKNLFIIDENHVW